MELGLFAESVGLGSLQETLEYARSLDITAIELSTGGQCERPLLDVDRLLNDTVARTELLRSFDRIGLRISALNASSFPLHPKLGLRHQDLTRRTLQLAELLQIDRVVVQSGVPGDSPNSEVPNWISYPWPAEMLDVVSRQWEQAIPVWQGLAAYARDRGVSKLCFELLPVNLVYNVPTFLRLRESIGEIVGVTVDPSHLIWQGMDVVACIHALASMTYHVHVKDVAFQRHYLSVVGVLDSRPAVPFQNRPWTFATPGLGHDATWWREVVAALEATGYGGTLSIEHEDPFLDGISAVSRTAAFMHTIL